MDMCVFIVKPNKEKVKLVGLRRDTPIRTVREMACQMHDDITADMEFYFDGQFLDDRDTFKSLGIFNGNEINVLERGTQSSRPTKKLYKAEIGPSTLFGALAEPNFHCVRVSRAKKASFNQLDRVSKEDLLNICVVYANPNSNFPEFRERFPEVVRNVENGTFDRYLIEHPSMKHELQMYFSGNNEQDLNDLANYCPMESACKYLQEYDGPDFDLDIQRAIERSIGELDDNFVETETAPENGKISSDKHNFAETETAPENGKISSDKNNFAETETAPENGKISTDKYTFVGETTFVKTEPAKFVPYRNFRTFLAKTSVENLEEESKMRQGVGVNPKKCYRKTNIEKTNSTAEEKTEHAKPEKYKSRYRFGEW